MAKAVQSGSGNIKFAGGVKTGRSFGPAPKNIKTRVSPVPHQYAAKAGKTGPIASFPNASKGVATAGINGKVFAK